jgi:hypothetical protein
MSRFRPVQARQESWTPRALGAPTPLLRKVSAEIIGNGKPLVSQGFRDRHWAKVRDTSAKFSPNSVSPSPRFSDRWFFSPMVDCAFPLLSAA